MTILIIAYAVFLLCLAVFGASAVYHAVRFGFPGDRTRLGVGLYLLLSVVILVASLIILGGADFSGGT